MDDGGQFDIAALLAATPLFSNLDENSLRALEHEVEMLHLSGGEILIREGDAADDIFIVASGRLRVYRDGPAPNAPQIIGEISRGETVGEMAILTGGVRQASVCAVRDTDIARIDRKGFYRFVAYRSQAMQEMARMLAERLRKSMESPHMPETVVTVAVIPGSPDVPTASVAKRLTGAFSELGGTLCLNAERVNEILGAGMAHSDSGSDNGRIVNSWLHDQEMAHRFVIYLDEAEPSPWTGRCIRQADRVLYLGMADGPPTNSLVQPEIEGADLGPRTARRELVLLAADSRPPPRNTTAWLDAVPVDRHHHVRLDNDGDFRRLSRLLTGQGLNLVLGGGGARGYAHIGAIRALAEFGMPVDVVGGTSMGAVVGGLYAMGRDWRDIVEQFRKNVADVRRLNDYTIPMFGLLNGKRRRSIMVNMFNDVRIEDLRIGYFCNSTNLTHACVKVHRKGSLANAVLASSAIPGVLPPTFEDGEVLVDGGILNNLPINIARDLSGGTVVAIDVSPPNDAAVSSDLDACPSSWELMWHSLRANRNAHKIPKITDILMRTVSVGSVQSMGRNREAADLYVQMPVADYGMRDWRRLDDLVEIGYRAMSERLENWGRERN